MGAVRRYGSAGRKRNARLNTGRRKRWSENSAVSKRSGAPRLLAQGTRQLCCCLMCCRIVTMTAKGIRRLRHLRPLCRRQCELWASEVRTWLAAHDTQHTRRLLTRVCPLIQASGVAHGSTAVVYLSVCLHVDFHLRVCFCFMRMARPMTANENLFRVMASTTHSS